MIPSIFNYAPDVAVQLFKLAAADEHDYQPGVAAPPASSAPQVVPPKPPPHPYVVGVKQLLPIGAGMTAGFATGLGIPALLYHTKILKTPPSYSVLSGIGATAGAIGGFAANILQQAQQAEMERAKQEYQDYLARRAAGGEYPSVQPPEVRT